MVLASPLALADQKYPAADFQPEVVYQDKDYIANDASSTSGSNSGSSSAADAKYPAANFEPKVIYNDANYKHVESPKAEGVTQPKATPLVEANSKVGESVAVEKKESSDSSMIFILVAAAVGLLFLFRSKLTGSGNVSGQSGAYAAPAGGAQQLTGVARYLNKVSGTGVSRYIEKQVKTSAPVTGVARYMAKQVTTAKTEATQAVTGVEKYMRNRG